MTQYEKLNFVNGSSPALSAATLNHMDDGIAAVTEGVTILEETVKNNKKETDTALESKADKTDVYSINEADEMFLSKWEAEQDYAKNISLENKADKNSVYTKAEVENALANKADTSDVESALAEKADKVEVENSLAEKANKTEVDESLSEKEAVNNKITDKRFITDSKANYPSIAFLEDYYYNVDEIDALLNGKDISTDTGTASITHTWDGTILTITTDSGTSSADLKGEQGIQGEKGETGADGKDGIDGVGIASTDMKTSTEDGGINVITFNFTDGKTTTCSFRNGSKGSQGEKGEAGADGKDGIDGVSPTVIVAENTDTSYKLSITNANGTITTPNLKGADGANGTDGKDGADGYTPVKGIDYFSEYDKTEIINAVIEYFGGKPISGYVDESNNIVINGNLSDGTYLLKYENADGTYTDIGTLDVGEVEVIINLFTTYTPILNKRWSNSSKAWSAQNGCVGFELPMSDVVGKTMRFSGFQKTYAGTSVPAWYAVDDTNTKVAQYDIFSVATVDEENNTYSWVVPNVDGAIKLMAFLPVRDNAIEDLEIALTTASASWILTE